jgi:methionine-rich copper-binding protein CopC
MLAAAAVLPAAPPAFAHAALVKSDPARRATLTKSPKQIRLWFSERLEPAYASVTLRRDGDANDIETAKASVDAGDPKLLVLDLPELAPGDYTVKYRVLSVDGHTVDYGYTFSIRP